MRTQIAKTGYLPAEYIPPTFWLDTPSPFCAGWRWGLLSRKIFLFFLIPLSTRSDYTSILILFFQIFVLVIQYKLSFRLVTSFARYSSSNFSLCIISYWFSLWILIFSFTIYNFDYNFGFCAFRFYISTRFYSYQFRLVSALSILCFDSSTLYLFNSSACYKQTSMLMWVWFMLILAILRLSDVFSFVLGVVYRLGLK